MKQILAVLALFALVMAGCSSAPEGLAVTQKTLRSQQNVSTSGLSEFGASGGGQAAATLFWIEGKITNSSATEYRSVMVQFRVQDSGSKKVLTAEIPSVPAGKSIAFATNQLQSYANVTLVDEPPEITGKPAD